MTKPPLFQTSLLLLFVALASAGPNVANAATFDHGVFPIDTSANPYLPTQQLPAAASDGGRFLVVWQDGRDSSGTGDIYGLLLDTAGTILTPDGFPVVHDTFAQSAPAAAYGDSAYLVVWTDKRADAAGDVCGARVSRAGALLDPNGIRICAAAGAQSEVAVVGGDSCWLVTWTDARQDKDIVGARVSWSGELLDTAGIPIAANYGDQSQSAVASDSDGFYAVWLNINSGDTSLYGVRVAASGLVLGPPARIAGDLSQGIAPIEPALAFGGANYLVVWRSRTTQTGVYGRFVSGSGVVAEPIVQLTTRYARKPRIVFDGARYFVLWADGSTPDICGVRVSSDGVVISDLITIVAASSAQENVAVAAMAGRCIAAWTDRRGVVVGGALLDSLGTVTTSDPIVSTPARRAGAQGGVHVVAYVAGYCVVWGADGCPIFARFDSMGRRLDAASELLTKGWGSAAGPAVATGDSVCLAVNGALGARVSKSGRTLDPFGFQIFTGGDGPDVCFGNGRFLVVGASNWRTISGALVSEAGQVVNPGVFTIQTGTTRLSRPSVAFDGTNFLVLWCDTVVNQYVYAKRIDTLGNVLEPVVYLGVARTNTGGADVAFGDSVYLAVWAYSANVWYIKGILVGKDGHPRGSIFTISDTSFYDGYATAPRVCFDGRDFVVTWASEGYNHDSTSVAGALVTQGGTTTRRFSLVTRSQRPEDVMPDVACGPEGRVLIAYTDICDQPGPLLGKYRIYGCFLDSLVAVSERGRDGGTEASLAASPNPFTRSVRIRVPTPAARGSGTVAFLNSAGRVVRTIPCAARQEVVWDGRDASGHAAPPGVYFCRFDGAPRAISPKLVKVE